MEYCTFYDHPFYPGNGDILCRRIYAQMVCAYGSGVLDRVCATGYRVLYYLDDSVPDI